MAYENIKLETTEGIATITVARPAVIRGQAQGFDIELVEAFGQALQNESL